MKICAACIHLLPKEKFSKKQWQLTQRRRCKQCIADNREVILDAPDDAPPTPPPPSCAEGEGDISCNGNVLCWTDEDLFKQSPPNEECPICMLPMPFNDDERQYYSCCGKITCTGCVHADCTENNSKRCPFCRTPGPTSYKEYIKRIKKRVGADDSEATYNLGCYYSRGELGLQQDRKKAFALWLRAGELGHAAAYYNIGTDYYNGEEGAERDVKKAKYYHELAAMGGYVNARYNLGCMEEEAGNMSRAVKHWMIAAGAGDDDSLSNIRGCFMSGHASKDDFEKALRAHKESNDEMRSNQREAAAPANRVVRATRDLQCRI